ncbi:hypothetical protein GOBAR_DD35727 [Gossypium barbadense]|nr:hypothetical protein GOBAR_DD35727 [Gossypium barbadense]
MGDMVVVFKDSWICNDANFYIDLVSLSGFEHTEVSELVYANERDCQILHFDPSGRYKLSCGYKLVINSFTSILDGSMDNDSNLLPSEMDNPSSIELFAEIAEPEPIQAVSHHDNKDFSDPNLDDIPKDINDESAVEGEDVHPHSVGNTRSGIVIRNNPRAFTTDVDLDLALTREFPEYPNIFQAHLLDEDLNVEGQFVGQQFDNKKDCLHTQMWATRKIEGLHTCTVTRMS